MCQETGLSLEREGAQEVGGRWETVDGRWETVDGRWEDLAFSHLGIYQLTVRDKGHK